MNNFTQRAITGLSFAFIMTAGILFSPWSFLALFFLISTIGLLEFYNLVKSDHVQPQVVSGVIIGQMLLLLLTFLLWKQSGLEWMMVSFPLAMLIFIFELYRKKPNPFLNIAVTLTGIIYLTIPVMLMLKIAFGFTPGDSDTYHGEVIMGCIFLIWASDTGAYMIGSKIGKRKLFERLSPKKSWEGFIGGWLTSLLAAFIISNWFPDLNIQQWMILACIIVISGTLGDLIESMLKRSTGVKDSGQILPGHGGILDRFDALFIAIPFVYFYLMIEGKL